MSLGRGVIPSALRRPFDHELALLSLGLKRIVKMEFAQEKRVERAQAMGFDCRPAAGSYGLLDADPDVVYDSGGAVTFFAGTEGDVSHALKLEAVERGDDPQARMEAMKELGTLLGYPLCCIERYQAQSKQDVSASFARLLGEGTEATGHFANNLFVLDHQLISHFPCTLFCKKSAALALEALEASGAADAERGEVVEGLLRAPIRVWDRFRFRIDHPELGELYADNISRVERVMAHPALQGFLSDLPTLPAEGTKVYWEGGKSESREG